MAKRDFYVLLGVSRTECAEGIRNAFRELALRYHPDRAGPTATELFQDIVEAYETLSDPRRRACYDRGLYHGSPDTEPAPKPTVRYGTPPSPPPEPLVPEHDRYVGDMRVTADVFEDLFERVLGSFARPRRRRRERRERRVRPIDVVVELSVAEAARGGTVMVDIPVFWPCPRCRGSGHLFGAPCPDCDETGLVEELRPLRVPLPSGVRHGTVLSIPVRGLGVHSLYVRVFVRVVG
jgi:DnaJ-class molecular chaperone